MWLLCGEKPEWVQRIRNNLAGTGWVVGSACLNRAALDDYDLHLPLTLVDAALLRARRSAGQRVAALLPSAAVSALCHDKFALNRALIDAGFADVVPAMPDPATASGRLILKQRQGSWGRGSRVIEGRPDDAALRQVAAGTHFLQRHIQGAKEWSTHLALHDGRIIFSRTARFDVPAVPHVKGHAQRALARQWLPQTPHLDLFARLLAAIGFAEGTCCIDYRIVQGRPRIFEINPRFGNSLCYSLRPYLEAYAKAVTGRAVSIQALPLAAE